MPKAVQYKPNSVVYFAGDIDDRVYLLQTGRIALRSIDIETGKQVTDYIREGEFFGVKSALGHYPREESVMVLTDSVVISFTLQEFEAFAHNNTRIVLKMLKVFSNQLRHIHRQIESHLQSEEQTNPEDGIYSVASCFYKSKQYRAAADIAKRYLALYPTGKHLDEMQAIASNTLFESNDSSDAQSLPQDTIPSSGASKNKDLELSFNLAEELAKKEKWDQAYNQYHSVMEEGASSYFGKASLGAGRCLYEQEEYVRTVQLLSNFISQEPKTILMGEVLLYLGMSYEKMEQADKAKAFYTKALSLAVPPLVPKIKELLQGLGE